MTPRKCKVCRHQSSGFCRRLSKPCSEVQDDSLFDPCGVSISDPQWDLRTHKDKATKKKLQEQEVLDSINEIEYGMDSQAALGHDAALAPQSECGDS